jgi:hypothetical protein
LYSSSTSINNLYIGLGFILVIKLAYLSEDSMA